CMGSLGCAMRAQGKLDEAEHFLRRRVEIERADNQDPLDDVDGLHALAMLLLAKGPLDEAEAVCREAIDAHKRLQKPEDHKLISLLNVLAEIHYAGGRLADAEATWRRSADVFELVRGRIGHSGFERIRFTAEASPFFRLAACLAQNEKPVEAWRRLEQGLARGLIDAVGIDTERLTDEERTERTRLLTALSAAEEAIAVDSEDGGAGIQDTRNDLRERSARRAALLEFDTRMASIHGAPSSHPFDLQRVQASLPKGTAIIAWIDLPAPPGSSLRRSEHFACVLHRNGNPAWMSLRGLGDDGAWTERDTSLARRVASGIALRPTARVGLNADLEALRLQRLKPIEHLLDGVTHLVALPVGDMGRVPLQALTGQYRVSYAPSATIFARLVEREKATDTPNPRRTLLALGDPIYAPTDGDGAQRLVGSGHEVRSIAQYFHGASNEPASEGGATLLLGPDATEASLQRLATSGSLRQYAYIHLSAHGLLDDFLPWRSSLLLTSSNANEATTPAYDDRLSAGQIAQTWRLNAELVTLSACETALGRSEGGEGFVGFSQALFASGARSLALSLWKVDDAATALLMSRFYENLTGSFSDERHVPGAAYSASQPMQKCDALAEAKRWLRTNTPDQNKAALLRLGFNLDDDTERLVSARGGIRVSGERAQVSYDYSDPHYWAAFVLSGDPN
ncbi:MAG: CHAT domain-containing protein, partial [Phycisphaerales bacterium]|nr:CHAT domain-containing protein [Phycisphaerales bacterium]